MSKFCSYLFFSMMNDCVKCSKVNKRSKLPDLKTKLPFQRCYKQTFQDFSSKHFNIHVKILELQYSEVYKKICLINR